MAHLAPLATTKFMISTTIIIDSQVTENLPPFAPFRVSELLSNTTYPL
jgi:hypothetical protein